MRRSDTIGELSKAVTKFQKDAPKITKDKTAKIPTKGGAGYEYKYADLSSIWEKIRGNLADCELAVIQIPTYAQSEPALTTMISHSSGEYIEDAMKLAIVQDTPQGQGSAITYARRYMLCAMLGLVADDDTDAQDHKTATPVQKKMIYDHAKKIMPEIAEDPLSMVRFLSEIVGKHPNRILETEVEEAIQAIDLYTKEQFNEA